MTSPPITPADLDEIRKMLATANKGLAVITDEHGILWIQQSVAERAMEALLSTRGDGIGSGGWQTMETAPRTGRDFKAKPFLAFCPDRDESDQIAVCWWEPGMKKWWGDGDFELFPTRWRHLPTPPVPSTAPGSGRGAEEGSWGLKTCPACEIGPARDDGRCVYAPIHPAYALCPMRGAPEGARKEEVGK